LASPAKAGISKTGEYLELEPFRRIVQVERMHMPDPTPNSHVEAGFGPHDDGTWMTLRMSLPDAQTRAATHATGMEQGMEARYARLETMI
jgi:uncharacterized protein YndB with AHSA1/START domain